MAAENEMPEVTGAEVTAPISIRFQNDLSEELKDRIKAEAAKRIDELVVKDEFSINDIAQLAGVSHGSIKGRAKSQIGRAHV